MGEGRRREKAVRKLSPPPHYRFLFHSRFSFRVAKLLYAPINGLPQDGEGGGGWAGGQPTGNLTFSGFKCQFPHP